MPLRHERPSIEYMRELKAVARTAAALRDHLPRVNLFPEGFPREQVEGFCNALVRLPDGTAEGSIAPLRAADSELNRIRQRFIPAHDEEAGDAEPLVPRNSDFDLRLVSLTAAVRAAIEHYKVESGDVLDTDVTPDRPVNPEVEAAKTAAFDEIDVALNDIHQAEAAMDAANPAVAAELDNEKRLIVSADVNVGSAGATLATESPRPTVLGWLEDNLNSVADEMDRIVETHKTKIFGVGKEIGGLAGDLLEIWLPKLTKSIKAVRVRLTNARLAIATSGDVPIQAPPADFDYAEVYNRLLRGEPIPDDWAPHVTELDLVFSEPHHLNTRIAERIIGNPEAFHDVSLLSNLTNLKILSVAGSQVTDLTPLVEHKDLIFLSLTNAPVVDLTPLKNLINLQTIYMGSTKVANLAPLESLTNLKILHLWGTHVADLAPLAELKNLQSLDLRDTKVADLAPLTNLTNLQTINLQGTQVDDVTPLANLANLQSLNLMFTKVVDVTPLAHLENLKIIWA